MKTLIHSVCEGKRTVNKNHINIYVLNSNQTGPSCNIPLIWSMIMWLINSAIIYRTTSTMSTKWGINAGALCLTGKNICCRPVMFDDGYFFFHFSPLTPTSEPLSLPGDPRLCVSIHVPRWGEHMWFRQTIWLLIKWLVYINAREGWQSRELLYWSWAIFLTPCFGSNSSLAV